MTLLVLEPKVKMERIPLSLRQALLLALVVAGPVLVSAGIVLVVAPGKTGMSTYDWTVFYGLVVFSALASGAVFFSVVGRRSVELSNGVLVVKSSFYSFELAKDHVSSIAVAEISKGGQLGISTKKNGVAAFGYLSGWFNAKFGERLFCAVSTYPVHHLTFTGHPKCSGLAISSTDGIRSLISEWINTPEESRRPQGQQ